MPAVTDPASAPEIALAGSMDPRTAPVRVGDTVRRPPGSSGEAVVALLRHLEAVGFDGAPRHLGTDELGREVLTYIEGDVPLPPYPGWALTDQALADLGALVRRFHEAAASFQPPAGAMWATDWADPTWTSSGADPTGGPSRTGAGLTDGAGHGAIGAAARPAGWTITHNDLFPENVVFRDGRVVALIDFAMAAPGRPLWDVAIAAEMWAPLGDPAWPDQHPPDLDGVARIGILARAYGLAADRAEELLDILVEERAHSLANIRAEIAAGNESWIGNWAAAGGDERAAADDRWIARHRSALVRAIAG